MTGTTMISVVVPFRNAGDYTKSCLDGLLQQDYPKELFEVLFVDNCSTDGSREFIEECEVVRCLSCPDVGPYHARNYGIQRSRGQIIALTDIDCVPSTDWLSNMERRFQDPRVGIVLGMVQFAGRQPLLRALENYENTKTEWICCREVGARYFGYANNMGISRDWMTKVGLFEALFRGADTVFVHRLIDQGGTDLVRYADDVRVAHLEINSVAGWARKRFIYGRSSHTYKNMVPSRPLTHGERWSIFHADSQRYHYGLGRRIIYFATLSAGLFCFEFGRFIARFLDYRRTSEQTGNLSDTNGTTIARDSSIPSTTEKEK